MMWDTTTSLSEMSSDRNITGVEDNIINNYSIGVTTIGLSPCGSFILYKKYMVGTKILLYLGVSLSLLVVLLNSVLVSVLLRRTTLTPTNILLAVLGISDSISCFFAYIPISMGYILGDLTMTDAFGIDNYIPGFTSFQVPYPFCIFIEWTYVITNSSFHALSICLTTILGLVKALVLRFPIKSRLFITNKVTLIACVLAFVYSVGFHLPYVLMKNFRRGGDNKCCVDASYRSYFPTMSVIIVTLYLSAFIILILSTTYICLKLTVWKSKVQSSEAVKNLERNRRSAIIVCIIIVIFILSEIPNSLCFISMTFANFGRMCAPQLRTFYELVYVLAYGSNFVIYWILSKNLRTQVISLFHNLCFTEKKATLALNPDHMKSDDGSEKTDSQNLKTSDRF